MPQLELEARRFSVEVLSRLDKLERALRRPKISFRLWGANVGEAVERQLSHHLILTFSLDTHLGIIEALDHGDRKIEHDVGEEHGCE